MTEFVDEPDTIRNEFMDDGLLMTDNRTTKLLCKLLEERGLDYLTHHLHVFWRVGPKLYDVVDNLDGTFIVGNLTPEQAIAATLGGVGSEVGSEVTSEVHGGKPPTEAKGDCSVCKGWKDDGRGGCCVFAADYWQPDCPYDKEVER